ncbi:hypothetical protein AMJ39_03910 [candidate division TA06 bacterium DG_24]|jgi:deoxyribonuclease V|uniref:Endonuclease V n=1 Tax=candidate division TA06 bacterium DG_24 TaxID=1703770 RepID=A0A0S7WU54_UNCT6|nr:MAG: hypothetical protein AMJ39_03910 [candidate division TA06 bacterium DG_24]
MQLVTGHRWKVSPREAIAIQERLATRISLEMGIKRPRFVAGLDVAFDSKRERAFGAAVVCCFPELTVVDEVTASRGIPFPYIPGLLSFRECPVLLSALKKLHTMPDLILVDGQGIAHPRGVGLAAHLGVLLGIPTIGCAKSKLVGEYREPARRRGSISPLRYHGRIVGHVVRTRTDVRPIFVSPGNLIDPKSAADLALACCKGYRLPEPTRIAHQRSREAKRR